MLAPTQQITSLASNFIGSEPVATPSPRGWQVLVFNQRTNNNKITTASKAKQLTKQFTLLIIIVVLGLAICKYPFLTQ